MTVAVISRPKASDAEIEITGLLRDPERAEQIGRNARQRVRNRFLSVRSLLDYLAVIKRLLADRSGAVATSR